MSGLEDGEEAGSSAREPRSSRAAACLVVFAAILAADAYAQGDTVYSRSVANRQRADVEADGLPAGSFRFYPSAGLEERFDDNIFSEDTGEDADYITSIKPAVRLESDWNNHALNFFADADFASYAGDSKENYQDYALGVDGRLDIQRDTTATAGLSLRHGHEDRGSADDVGGASPTETDTVSAFAGIFHRFGLLNASLDVSVDSRDFDDVRGAPGVIINNDDRDREEYDVSLRVGYEIVPKYEAYVRASYLPRSYDAAVDDNGFDRDSDGYEIVAGADVELSGITAGSFFLGYRQQDPDAPALSSIKGLTFGGDLVWNATRITTVSAGLARNVEETTTAGSAGFFATRLSATVDHELLRNLVLGATASFTRNDYDGISREDDDVGAGIYANYMMSRFVHLNAAYDFTHRNSNVVGSDYTKNVFMVRLTAQY